VFASSLDVLLGKSVDVVLIACGCLPAALMYFLVNLLMLFALWVCVCPQLRCSFGVPAREFFD